MAFGDQPIPLETVKLNVPKLPRFCLNHLWHFALSRPSYQFVFSLLLRNRWPEAGLADLCLALGIAIFSKSTPHGHCLEDLTSDSFNLVNNVPKVYLD